MADTDLAFDDLPTIVRNAWADGQKIDLSGVGYGRLHWGNQTDVRDEPSPYYYFLAGLVRRFNFSKILEIGTHWGGATRAMHRGMLNPQYGKIVTVDITTESDNRLKDYPDIVKIVGDGNSPEVFTKVMSEFETKPADLVYIDAEHQMMPTFTSFAIYAMALRPKLIVLDDVTLSDGMRQAWGLIKATVSERDSINAAEVVRTIRPSPDNPGFGVVRLEKNVLRGL